MDGCLRNLNCTVQMRNACTLYPCFHNSQQSLYYCGLSDRLCCCRDKYSQHIRDYLPMLSRCLRMEQIHTRRKMHRWSCICQIHGNPKRHHWGHHAHHANTFGMETEPQCFRKDCIDGNIPARNHVSLSR